MNDDLSFSTSAAPAEESVDIGRYFYLLWHWSWLLLLAALLAAAAAFFVSRQMTPIYESTTSILVMEAPSNKSIDYSSLQTSQSLTKTYSNMLTTPSVLGEVIKRLGLTLSETDLEKKIKVTPVTSTQLIDISVQDPNPALAAQVANTLFQVFSEQIQSIQSSRFAASRDSLKTQVTEMEAKQADVDQQRKAATDPAEQERLDTLALQYKQLYASLMTSYEQARLAEIQASANIVQVYQAAPGTEPVSPKIIQNTIIAALIGLLLAALAVFGLDALDDTLKTPEEVSTALNLPVLGVIFQHKIKLQPVALEEPRSPVAEAFRTLRTNIQYANVDEPLRTLLITSPLPGEGKTTISANLAVVFAHAGKRVYYADADLRHPTVHKKFGIPNNSGLTQLILDPDLPVAQFSQNGKVPGLHVVTCGDLPPNPAELLGSKKMATLLDKFKSESDLVILDSPPVLAVSDPAVLAPSVDGVILVLRPGKTTRRAALQAIDALRQVAAPLIGVVLNDVHTNGHSYSYYYRHGYYPHKYKYYGKNEGKSSK